jgi:AcrR family transcriptional regulator
MPMSADHPGTDANPRTSDGPGAETALTKKIDPAREPLSRRTVLVAGIHLIEEDGVRQLTMRRLGAKLHVEAMALYRHISGRDDLLDGIVELVMDDLYADPEVHIESGVWQDYLTRLGHGVRRLALTYPQVFPILATRPPAAPWLRPPLRSLRWTESFLGTLRQAGFSDDAAVRAYRSFSSFLLGFLLLEVAALGSDTGPVEQADPGGPTKVNLNDYPNIKELEQGLSQDLSSVEFEESLEAMLDRIELFMRRDHRH